MRIRRLPTKDTRRAEKKGKTRAENCGLRKKGSPRKTLKSVETCSGAAEDPRSLSVVHLHCRHLDCHYLPLSPLPLLNHLSPLLDEIIEADEESVLMITLTPWDVVFERSLTRLRDAKIEYPHIAPSR